MNSKRCQRCLHDLPHSSFYKHAANSDGLQSYCRGCQVNYNRIWREQNPELVAKWAPERLLHEPGDSAAYIRANPEKRQAHKAVALALKTGRLVRPSACTRCGCACKAQAHHEDYDRLLDVIWLCQRCHMRLHAGVIAA